MIKSDVVTDLFLAVVDSWTEYRGGEKINPELCDIIEQHLHYAFVAGFDELAKEMMRVANNHANRTKEWYIPVSFVKAVIMNKHKDNEIDKDNPLNS